MISYVIGFSVPVFLDDALYVRAPFVDALYRFFAPLAPVAIPCESAREYLVDDAVLIPFRNSSFLIYGYLECRHIVLRHLILAVHPALAAESLRIVSVPQDAALIIVVSQLYSECVPQEASLIRCCYLSAVGASACLFDACSLMHLDIFRSPVLAAPEEQSHILRCEVDGIDADAHTAAGRNGAERAPVLQFS